MAGHWNEDLARLLPLTPEGADSAALNSAMKQFMAAWQAVPRSDSELDTAVADIAAALPLDLVEAHQAFDLFRQEATEESLNEFKEGFAGSKQQLLFGHVVGEVLKMPPVFAAMLSPTGGMVGPGGFSFHVKGGVLGYHGVAHDAGGYLCRRHQVAPGYEYVIVQGSQPCETSPLAGQVSGIAFWFKLLNLSWLSFLAVSDLSAAGPGPTADISDLLEPGPISLAEPSAADSALKDGVTLNPSELGFLQAIITREASAAGTDMAAEGLQSLHERGLVTGDEQQGYQVSDQLIMAAAVFLEPQLMLEAAPAGVAAEDQLLRLYRWGDFIVEQTIPAPDQIRLAGVRDVNHAQERLLMVLPLAESDLAELSLSLTEDEFETAVATAAAAEIEHGPAADAAGSEPAAPSAVNDLTAALDSGEIIGTLRVEQFDGRALVKSRSLQLIHGTQATWLVGRDSEDDDRVNIALATPSLFTRELSLSATES